jgi:O-antigen/teichoic acid export membrane protein
VTVEPEQQRWGHLRDAASGARWGVGLFIIGRVLAMVTRVFLYRIDKVVFGSYVVVTEIIAFSAAQFLVPGGMSAIIRFMPALSQERRRRFLVAYSLLALVLCAIAVVVLQITPAPLKWLLRSEGRNAPIAALTRYSMAFVPLVAMQTVAVYALMAQGKTAAAAKAQNFIQIIIFFFSVLLFLFPAFTIAHAWLVVVASVGLAHAITLCWAAAIIRRLYFPPGERASAAPLLPKGFAGYAAMSHTQFAAQWVGNTLDQALVCRYMGRAQLAMYGAGLSVARFVRWIPITVGNQLLPLFSQLAAEESMDEMRRLYRRVTLYNSVCALSTALVCIVLGPQILLVFGKDASVYSSSVLAVLSASFFVSAVSVVNVNALLALGRADLTVVIYVLAAAIEISLAVLLGSSADAVQYSLMRTSYLLVAFFLSTWLVWRLYSFSLSKKTYMSVLATLLAWAIFVVLGWTTDIHQVWRAVISLAAYPVLLIRIFRALDSDDWQFALDHILPAKLGRMFKKGNARAED